MRCGAACGQGLRTQHSMRMHFLLSAPSLVETIIILTCFLYTNADATETANNRKENDSLHEENRELFSKIYESVKHLEMEVQIIKSEVLVIKSEINTSNKHCVTLFALISHCNVDFAALIFSENT